MKRYFAAYADRAQQIISRVVGQVARSCNYINEIFIFSINLDTIRRMEDVIEHESYLQ